jgi:hypothetical protein
MDEPREEAVQEILALFRASYQETLDRFCDEYESKLTLEDFIEEDAP